MIKYIGVDDCDIDLFESQYEVPLGMSYNSYLILDEHIAIMDTVDARKGEEWLQNLEAGLEGRDPEYLIIHHLEPDHSSLIAEVVSRYPGITLVASARAMQMLPQFFTELINYQLEDRALVVKEGDTLSLGHHNLHFIAAPMVHWPEVIMSYDETEGILFSADGFGKFGRLQNNDEDWACEARRYYFNICGKYGAQVQNVLRKAAGIDIRTICPLHGPMIGQQSVEGVYAEVGVNDVVSLYNTWSTYEVETPGILIAYASIHGGTQKAAEYLYDCLKERAEGKNLKIAITDLSRDDEAEAIEDAFRMDTLVLAAPTYDGDIFPPMHSFIHHLKMKGYQNRRVAFVENGSWAPLAGKVMQEMLSGQKALTFVEQVVTIRSRMSAANQEELKTLAATLIP